MHHFAYRNGVLHAEAVNLAAIAEKVATPFYCYSTATLARHYGVFADAFADVPALRAGLLRYLAFYNEQRRHQALGYRTPAAAYRQSRQAA